MTFSKHCPVCNMSVSNNQISSMYRGLEFWFCSPQCRDRFKLIPELFIGDPRHGKSAKQQGISIEKQRNFRFELPEDEKVQAMIKAKLESLMGVTAVNMSSNTLEIEYDLVQVSLDDIEKALHDMQIGLAASWLEKLHRAMIHFSEENQLSSLKHPPKNSACH